MSKREAIQPSEQEKLTFSATVRFKKEPSQLCRGRADKGI